MRLKGLVIVVASSSLGLALSCTILAWTLDRALVREEEIARVRSPSGSMQVRYLTPDGGAMTDFASFVLLRRRWQPQMFERAVIAMHGKPALEFVWRSDSDLLVRWTRCANDPSPPRVRWHEKKWNHVAVSFEEGPPIPADTKDCVELADYLKREREWRKDLAEYEARYGKIRK